jgi:uroporphyrinogen decarboxylase
MNSRERIRTILSKQVPDRMGASESFWPETIPAWLAQGYPRKDGAPDGPALPAQEVFGFDIWGGGPWFDWSPRRGVQEIVEETEDTRLVKNAFGASLRYWKKKSGTPEHVHFEMTNRAYWDNLKGPLLELDPTRLGDMKAGGDAIRELQSEGKFVSTGSLFVYEWMRASMGDFVMMTNFLEDPEWIRDFCRVYTDFFIKHYRLYFEQAAKPDALFMFDDLGYTNGLWASPKIMGDLVMPFHKELVDFAHSQGIFAMLHTCGDVRQGMDLILDAGYDLVQPMEAKVGNDVLQFAEKYGARIAYMGNINIMVLETGDRAAIRKEIETKLRRLREMRIPYVFHSDHSVPPTVTYDTYRYANEVFRECAEY